MTDPARFGPLGRALARLTAKGGGSTTEMVVLDEVPRCYALYRPEDVEERPDEGVESWVFALPDGRAAVVPAESGRNPVMANSLDSAERRWARIRSADLVAVTARARRRNLN